jgi:hypothetical protein
MLEVHYNNPERRTGEWEINLFLKLHLFCGMQQAWAVTLIQQIVTLACTWYSIITESASDFIAKSCQYQPFLCCNPALRQYKDSDHLSHNQLQQKVTTKYKPRSQEFSRSVVVWNIKVWTTFKFPPWSRGLLGKLIVAQLVKKLPTFIGVIHTIAWANNTFWAHPCLCPVFPMG